MNCPKCKSEMEYHSEYVDDNKGNCGICRYHECPKCLKLVFEEAEEEL